LLSFKCNLYRYNLAAGKCMSTLTYHKKGVRALAFHPKDFTLMSASADNIKKFGMPRGTFMHNMLSQQKTIVNSLACNEVGPLYKLKTRVTGRGCCV
jgi:pleiotropic regulator 1